MAKSDYDVEAHRWDDGQGKHPKGDHWHAGRETCCRGCGYVWTAHAQGHCSGCHRQFGGGEGFTQHQKADRCLSDRELGRRGMVKKKGVWVRVRKDLAPPPEGLA